MSSIQEGLLDDPAPIVVQHELVDTAANHWKAAARLLSGVPQHIPIRLRKVAVKMAFRGA